MPSRTRTRRRPPQRPRRINNPIRRQSPNSHTTSEVIGTITLKTKHNREEVYPLPLSTIISRANTGPDADIRAVGYSVQLTLATGNHTETVTANLGHSGDWIRRGNSIDTFNQQFMEHTFRNNSILFRKRVLHDTEREYINPDSANNSIDLRIRDPCGVIPGVTLRYQVRFHLIRPTPQATFLKPNDPATDLYEDQDVSSSGSGPQPPVNLQDVPQTIINIRGSRYITTSTASPLTYTASGSDSYVVTAAGTINIVGVFTNTDSSAVQTEYTAEGFEGNIVYQNF